MKNKLVTVISSYFIIFVLGGAILGGIFYHPKTTIKETVKEVYPHEQQWRNLKEIDDKGFGYSAEFAGLCSDIVAGAYYRSSDIELITAKVNSLAQERQKTLRELGY